MLLGIITPTAGRIRPFDEYGRSEFLIQRTAEVGEQAPTSC